MSGRTALGRVRGLGAAKDGTHHWWVQRLTSIALVPLTLWFVISVVRLVGADHGAVAGWIASPVPAVLLVDVAHVYATGFRVYFDRAELRRRRWLYTATPVAALTGAMLVYQGVRALEIWSDRKIDPRNMKQAANSALASKA